MEEVLHTKSINMSRGWGACGGVWGGDGLMNVSKAPKEKFKYDEYQNENSHFL